MASRKDYAKKKRGKASASRASSTPKKAPARKTGGGFPTGLLALALLLMAGLGYGLYQLTQVDPDKVQKPITAVSKPTAEKTKPVTKPAPAKPATTAKTPSTAPSKNQKQDEKRFEFYEMLEKSEVETSQVDAYKSTPKDPKSQSKYLLQAGSFKLKADAEKMRAQLILLGLPNVHTNTSKNKDGTLWFRVRVGPFESRSHQAKAYDKLVQQNIQPLRIKQ